MTQYLLFHNMFANYLSPESTGLITVPPTPISVAFVSPEMWQESVRNKLGWSLTTLLETNCYHCNCEKSVQSIYKKRPQSIKSINEKIYNEYTEMANNENILNSRLIFLRDWYVAYVLITVLITLKKTILSLSLLCTFYTLVHGLKFLLFKQENHHLLISHERLHTCTQTKEYDFPTKQEGQWP